MDDELQTKSSNKVNILTVGEGPVRIGVGNGYTIEVGNVFIKPHFYIEIPVPEGYNVEEYVKLVNDFVDRELRSLEKRALRLAGIADEDTNA